MHDEKWKGIAFFKRCYGTAIRMHLNSNEKCQQMMPTNGKFLSPLSSYFCAEMQVSLRWGGIFAFGSEYDFWNYITGEYFVRVWFLWQVTEKIICNLTIAWPRLSEGRGKGKKQNIVQWCLKNTRFERRKMEEWDDFWKHFLNFQLHMKLWLLLERNEGEISSKNHTYSTVWCTKLIFFNIWRNTFDLVVGGRTGI